VRDCRRSRDFAVDHVAKKPSRLWLIVLWLLWLDKDSVIELFLLFVFIVFKKSHSLWSFGLFLCTVYVLAIRLPFVNKLELSWVRSWLSAALVTMAAGSCCSSSAFSPSTRASSTSTSSAAGPWSPGSTAWSSSTICYIDTQLKGKS